jgi:hypothetical protein
MSRSITQSIPGVTLGHFPGPLSKTAPSLIPMDGDGGVVGVRI